MSVVYSHYFLLPIYPFQFSRSLFLSHTRSRSRARARAHTHTRARAITPFATVLGTRNIKRCSDMSRALFFSQLSLYVQQLSPQFSPGFCSCDVTQKSCLDGDTYDWTADFRIQYVPVWKWNPVNRVNGYFPVSIREFVFQLHWRLSTW
jgi:hypothetical protein